MAPRCQMWITDWLQGNWETSKDQMDGRGVLSNLPTSKIGSTYLDSSILVFYFTNIVAQVLCLLWRLLFFGGGHCTKIVLSLGGDEGAGCKSNRWPEYLLTQHLSLSLAGMRRRGVGRLFEDHRGDVTTALSLPAPDWFLNAGPADILSSLGKFIISRGWVKSLMAANIDILWKTRGGISRLGKWSKITWLLLVGCCGAVVDFSDVMKKTARTLSLTLIAAAMCS